MRLNVKNVSLKTVHINSQNHTMMQKPAKGLEWEKAFSFIPSDPGTASLLGVVYNGSLTVTPNRRNSVSFPKLICNDFLLHKIN